jgi:hypothetical protein
MEGSMKAFRLQYFLALSAVLAFLPPGAAKAEGPFPASEIAFQDIFGSRAGERSSYCLLGNGYFRTIRSEEAGAVITGWLAQHPKALAVPVSSRPLRELGPPGRWIYVLIEDGEDALNIVLVQAGAFPGRVMIDAAEAPQRIMPEERYRAYLNRVLAAQSDAKENRRGIWGDEYKEQRALERLDD